MTVPGGSFGPVSTMYQPKRTRNAMMAMAIFMVKPLDALPAVCRAKRQGGSLSRNLPKALDFTLGPALTKIKAGAHIPAITVSSWAKLLAPQQVTMNL
jgi:hypothetical protein